MPVPPGGCIIIIILNRDWILDWIRLGAGARRTRRVRVLRGSRRDGGQAQAHALVRGRDEEGSDRVQSQNSDTAHQFYDARTGEDRAKFWFLVFDQVGCRVERQKKQSLAMA